MLERCVEILKEEIVVLQRLELSHAGTVWDGALVLSYFLQKQCIEESQYKQQNWIVQLIRNKNILELGAGTGILGLSLIPFMPRKVIMTDLPEYTGFIQENIVKNQDLIAKYSTLCPSGLTVCSQALTWGDMEQHEEYFEGGEKIDTIIASEVAYSVECITDLIASLVWLKKNHNPGLKMLVSYQKYPQKDRNLLKRLLQYSGLGMRFEMRKMETEMETEMEAKGLHCEMQEIPEDEMDEEYRDSMIGILVIK